MAENAGSIVYTVDVDTANMIKAESVIDRSLKSQTKRFNKADIAVREYMKRQDALGRTINRMGQVIDRNGNIVRSATIEYRKLSRAANDMFNSLDSKINGVGGSANSSAMSISKLGGVASAVFSALTLNSVRRMADNMILLENRLKTVTSSNIELAQVQARLFTIAQQTNSSLSSTVELYARVARSTKDLGLTQQQMLVFTKALNQSFQLGGASADEASNAIIQLSQALSSGLLQAEEFNSISDQAPLILEALAEETGRARSELKKLGSEGKITAETLVRAVIRSAGKWEQEYSKLNKTSEQAFGNLANATGLLVSNLDKASGFTNGLVRAMNEVAAVVTVIASRAPMMGDGIAASLTPIRSLVALLTDGPAAAGKVIEDAIALTQRLASGSEIESFLAQLNEVRGALGLPVEGAATDITITGGIQFEEKSPIDLALERFRKKINEFKLSASEAGTAIGESFGDIAVAGVDKLSDSLAEALVSGQNAGDVIRNVARMALTEMLASLIKVGIQYGINALMANSAMATTTATAVASGAAITAAMAPAAAATSIATAGAAPAAATGITLSSIAAIVGALTVGALAGAREFGGPVTAGKSYLVGERGPEIFTPGMGGGITSNKDLMSGGGVNVNVYNYGNDNVQVKQNGRDVDIIIKQVVNTVAGQINSGQGPVGKALKGAGVKVSAIGG